ncbi:hypothetical protein [Antrihabitans stalactiti]|jgi:uncharacterized coiled-coil protein SlyX|uniref:Uncharacterized protein n=1 Tax=Antrihabitans stalactiti TaxID=2584121 RepID=A0A848KM55_9NOCA|nr:hypothetical protein [Antrihabitans stalactiti]NMN99291.1 hypothetical protein [Antrihabitans stalactiti]
MSENDADEYSTEVARGRLGPTSDREVGVAAADAEKLSTATESITDSGGVDSAVERNALQTRNDHLAQQVEALTRQNERLVAALKSQSIERNQLTTTVAEQSRAFAYLQARFDRVTTELHRFGDELGGDWSAQAEPPGTADEHVNGFAAAASESGRGFGVGRDREGMGE